MSRLRGDNKKLFLWGGGGGGQAEGGWGYCTLKFGHRKLDISKTITARSFKFGMLIKDKE